jgi:excisionase family DNA binding protein
MNTPDLLTITEAAVVLRIGRTTAYELARRDLATDGGEGLGVIRVGGQLRVPRVALERLVGAPIVFSVATGADNGAPRNVAATVLPAAVPDPTPSRLDHPSDGPGRRRRLVSVDQLTFDA